MGKPKSNKAKNKKATWKKLQHDDVEEFLDEARLEERLGLSEKSDDQLFCIDTGYDAVEAGPRATWKNVKKTVDVAKPLVDIESLKCFQILKPHTNVPDPVLQRNRIRKPGERKTVDMKMKDEMRYYKRETKAKAKLAAKRISKISKRRVFDRDLWTDESPMARDLPSFKKKLVNYVATCDELYEDTKHHLVNPIKHKVNRKTSGVAAVETPHPGLSYNPTFKDHQDIVGLAVEEEKQRLQREQKLIRATHIVRYTKSEDEEEEVEIKTEDEDEDKKLVLQPKPKTRQQKRREREQLEIQRNSRLRKANNAREGEVFRVKSLVKSIERKETRAKVKLAKKISKIQEREKTGVKTLSKHKFVELPVDPLLSDSLPGSLRAIPVHLTNTSNILVDRFQSFQKRNIVEPRVRVKMVRKNKLKKYQRPSEKMEWEKTGEWNGIKLPNPHGRKKRRN